MKRHLRPWIVAIGLALAPAGCDYSSDELPPIPTGVGGDSASTSDREASASGGAAAPSVAGQEVDRSRRGEAILNSVINLIDTAALKPGGDNFRLATTNLNELFEGTPAAEFALNPADREYLLTQMPSEGLKGLERASFEMPDARHLEDCMLYYGIATRVAGTGDDLSRVLRVFDWMVRHVQLVPAGSLGAPGLGQAYARPYDVLLRGMATESEGGWSERGWLFLSLCRQLGIDAGLLTYTSPGAKEPTAWICAALIDGKLYLFDPALGVPVPGPGGKGVATLDEALSDPNVLGGLDLPGERPYAVNRAALAASPSKIGILMDSGPGYLSPRMRLLQDRLAGKNRTILFRSPADQRDRFVKALGANSGGVSLWGLPMTVQTLLFSNPKFVEATQQALRLFDPKLPLLYARVKQLRGELPEAIADYMKFRFAENALQMDQKTPIPPEVQQALDMTSTYFLALAHLERNNPKQAALFFSETLRLLPAPGPRQPYFQMFRWGAQTNLARLHEDKGEFALAIAYDSEPDPTPQSQGNLLRARVLVWRDPMASVPVPLPPSPTSLPR